jgi:hypothetical protein
MLSFTGPLNTTLLHLRREVWVASSSLAGEGTCQEVQAGEAGGPLLLQTWEVVAAASW